MKKSLRILTVFSIAASSFLFATPSHAATVGGVDVTVSGNVTIATSSANKITFSGYSDSANDNIIFDFGGNSFSLADLNELWFFGIVAGIPSAPVTGYNKTINMALGRGYFGSADIYSGGSRILQSFTPSSSNNSPFTPFVQFNYIAATGVVSIQVPVTTGNRNAKIAIDSNGDFAITGAFGAGTPGTISSWYEVGTFSVGSKVGAPSAPTNVVATATGKRSATVSFAAPASNNGSAVTTYTATSTPGGTTKTLTQATGGTFTFDGLEPNTSYTFAVTATNAIGTSAAATSNSTKTDALIPASISSLTFVEDGTGTGGKIVWAGKSLDAVLYTGPISSYPGPYTYGAFTGGWNGRIRNLTPNTEYTISIYAISADGVGESKSLTFKTSATLSELVGAASSTAVQTSETKLSQMINWVNENTFNPGEAANMTKLLTKFMAIETSPHRSFVRVPTSRVSRVVATSLTPNSCCVENQGIVTALSADTCTISYTVTGGSKAPATMVKDFVFKKFTN